MYFGGKWAIRLPRVRRSPMTTATTGESANTHANLRRTRARRRERSLTIDVRDRRSSMLVRSGSVAPRSESGELRSESGALRIESGPSSVAADEPDASAVGLSGDGGGVTS